MYVLKLKGTHGPAYVATPTGSLVYRQRDALRIPDNVAELAKPISGYFRVDDRYRLVKLIPHARASHPLDAPIDRFDEDEWANDL